MRDAEERRGRVGGPAPDAITALPQGGRLQPAVRGLFGMKLWARETRVGGVQERMRVQGAG
jgi:hypothetical protein